MASINKNNLLNTLKIMLLEGTAKTQQEICQALLKHGHDVNQTKISRLLRKLGAVKVKNDHGQVVYLLPKDPPPPETSSSIANLVIDVIYNESLIIVHTSPGAAQVIARILDYWGNDSGILGTIAGDNTVFVAPKSVSNIKQIAKLITTLLG